MPRVHPVSQLCCSGLSTSGRNQALLSQQEENLPQLGKSYLSQTHLQCLFCTPQFLTSYCPTKWSWYKTQDLQNKYSPEHILLSQFSPSPHHFCLHCLQYRLPTLVSISVHGSCWYSFSRSIQGSVFDCSSEERELGFSAFSFLLITSFTAFINFWVSSFVQGL